MCPTRWTLAPGTHRTECSHVEQVGPHNGILAQSWYAGKRGLKCELSKPKISSFMENNKTQTKRQTTEPCSQPLPRTGEALAGGRESCLCLNTQASVHSGKTRGYPCTDFSGGCRAGSCSSTLPGRYSTKPQPTTAATETDSGVQSP